MRGSYCTSNWFYGLIAVYYQSRLMNVKRTHISLPFSPLGYRYPLGNCLRRLTRQRIRLPNILAKCMAPQTAG